ncbi:MAG: hypothetical protein HYX68_20065 [Planctomycetes bacterium]|nr:hypothetical protein [Planctomycetota bacterium]
MKTTQLTCPNCRSSLKFGAEIAAGMSVECLICMKPFVATNPVVMDAPAPAPAPPRKPAPAKTSVSASKPGAELAQPSAPRLRKPASSSGGLVTAAVAVAVLLLVAGAGFGIWKFIDSNSAKSGPDKNTDGGPIALNPKKGDSDKSVIPPKKKPEKEPDPAPKKTNTDQVNNNPPEKKAPPKKSTEEPEPVKKDDEKPKLVRKETGKPKVKDPILTLEPKKEIVKKKEPGQKPVPLVGVTQFKIDSAITKGVAYLKKSQLPSGTWPSEKHAVGHASLGGLALLECKVATDDPSVVRAARFVRANVGSLNSTYDISTAVLFLDRLGDAADRPIIQGLALRLIASQDAGGGWGYICNVLSPRAMYDLFDFLQKNKKSNVLNPLGTPVKQAVMVANPATKLNDPSDPFYQFAELVKNKGAGGAGRPFPAPGGGLPLPLPGGKQPLPLPIPGGKQPLPLPLPGGNPPLQPLPGGQPPVQGGPLPGGVQDPLGPGGSNAHIPAVKFNGKTKNQVPRPEASVGNADNSNTQFALLALWAARRHDVPADYALAFAYQRFMASQVQDGGWGYGFVAGVPQGSHTMTCVGLLGLALGHGVAPEVVKFDAKNPKNSVVKPPLQDAAIQRALTCVTRYIGQPHANPNGAQIPMENLYFLWSVERVAVLYDLKTMGGKDWYSWGAQILVRNQDADAGDWRDSNYTGANPAVNTCFALLFLRRSNLVQDLTNDLRFYSGIRQVD